MAGDINRKITIDVELEAEKLTQNITNLNKSIDSLLAKQQQLNTSGQQNSTAFDNISAKLDVLQKKLQDATARVNANATALNALSTSNKTAESSLSSLTIQHQNNAKAVAGSSAKTKELIGQTNSLGLSLKQQKGNAGESKSTLDTYSGSLAKSSSEAQQLAGDINAANSALGEQATIVSTNKAAFDAHKITMDHLKTSFDEIKDVSGIFGPSLSEAAGGFNMMKTGVAHATSKIGTAFNTVKKGIQEAANQMVSAYKEGYNQAGKHVNDHEQRVMRSINRQVEGYNKLQDKVNTVYAGQTSHDKNDDGPLQGKASGVAAIPPESIPALSVKLNPVAQAQKDADKIVEIKKTAQQQVEDFARQSAGKIASDALNVLTGSIKQQSDAKVAALEKDKAAELSNNSLTSAQKLAIAQKYKKQEDAIKAKAFKQQQEISIMQALINGALAITKAEADLGPIAGTIAVAGIIANTAIQVASIAKQKPPAMAKGGFFKSDGKWAILSGYSKQDDTNAYLRSGEAVVVSEAMQVPWARNLVSAINVGFGGRDFSVTNPGRGYAVGGIFTDGGDANRYYNQPVTDQKNLANTIAYQMINNFPPVYVDVKDINTQQNILAQTIIRVNL
jgi:hypothetical protein